MIFITLKTSLCDSRQSCVRAVRSAAAYIYLITGAVRTSLSLDLTLSPRIHPMAEISTVRLPSSDPCTTHYNRLL